MKGRQWNKLPPVRIDRQGSVVDRAALLTGHSLGVLPTALYLLCTVLLLATCSSHICPAERLSPLLNVTIVVEHLRC